MHKLLKSSFLMGSTEIALILINILRSKYLAVTIGPEGLGAYSILNSFFLMASAFCGGWFSVSYIKYVSKYYALNDKHKVDNIHNSAVIVTILFVLILAPILILYKDYIIRHYLSPEILDFHYGIFTAIFITTSFKYIYEYHLNATIKIKETIKAKIFTNITEFLSILIMVYFFNLIGFYLSLLISSIFGLIIFRFFTKTHLKQKIYINKSDLIESKEFVITGSKNIPLLFINNFSQYFFRVTILNSLNFASVGIFHAVNNLSTYIGIFTRGSNYSYIPNMNKEITNIERNNILNDYLRLNTSIGLILTTLSIFTFDFLIKLFFSKQFSTTEEFSHLFLIAQYLTIFVYALQAIILGINNYKSHFIVVIITNLIWIFFPLFFIDKMGLKSIAVSFIIANLWSILYNYFYLKNKIKIKIDLKVIVFTVLYISFIIIAVIIKKNSLFVKSSLLIFELFVISLLLKKNEYSSIRDTLKNLLQKTNKI